MSDPESSTTNLLPEAIPATAPVEDTHPTELPEPGAASETPLSKNAQKKAARLARFAAAKPERRAREKEAKKEKKKLKRAAEYDQDGESSSRKRAKVEREGNAGGEREKFRARLVVDLGFDDKMLDKVSFVN